MATKLNLLEPNSEELSIRKQCQLMNVDRNHFNYNSIGLKPDEIKIMQEIDLIYTTIPTYGYRRMWKELLNRGFELGRDRTLKYMQMMNIQAIFPKRKTSIPNSSHKIYPYLLRGLKIIRPNQVWSTDITYVRMNNSFCFLVAVIDWFSRGILSHRVSNVMTVDFCIDALEDALSKYPHPEIFNSDQGSQFTSSDFTRILLNKKIKISMDDKGRAIDNIVIERFWRTIKYEDIYVKNYLNLEEAKYGIKKYIEFYNQVRLHSALDYQTPFEVYF